MDMSDKPKKKKPRWFIPFDKMLDLYESEDDYYKQRIKRNILKENK